MWASGVSVVERAVSVDDYNAREVGTVAERDGPRRLRVELPDGAVDDYTAAEVANATPRETNEDVASSAPGVVDDGPLNPLCRQIKSVLERVRDAGVDRVAIVATVFVGAG